MSKETLDPQTLSEWREYVLKVRERRACWEDQGDQEKTDYWRAVEKAVEQKLAAMESLSND